MMNAEKARPWIARWMYGVAAGHLLVGILLPWIGDLSLLDVYHRSVETGFWQGSAPSAARTQQIWWISLFGPTVQTMSLWMGALIYIGDRQRSAFAWGCLIAGLILWAPQDMLISLRAGAWIHVWVDSFAVVTMLPPLAWLYWHDRKKAGVQSRSNTTFSAAPT